MDRRGAEAASAQLMLQEQYQGKVEHQRFHGFGHAMLASGSEYQGEFAHGRAEGLGTIVWEDGLKYVGEFSDNSATGQGCLSWPNGAEYFGDIKRGRRHGVGVHTFAETRYAGEWKDGRRHGIGSQFTEDSVYYGEWENGKRHGWGMIQFASGNRYQGMWKEDLMEGYGTMQWVTLQKWCQRIDLTNVTSYKEAVEKARNAVMNVGSTTSSSLGPYTPSTLASNSVLQRYVGLWKANRPHGRGEYTTFIHTPKGNSREVPFQTQNRYVGDFVDGQREGHGTYYYADGTVYEGNWKQNLKHGEGCIYHPDGTGDSVVMENDAPSKSVSRGRSEKGIQIQDLLPDVVSVDRLGTKDDTTVSQIREILSMYNNYLRHLYVCYAKWYSPIDLFATAEASVKKGDVPHPARIAAQCVNLIIPASCPALKRNELMTNHAVSSVVDRAMDACNAAISKVMAASEGFHAAGGSEVSIVEGHVPTAEEIAEASKTVTELDTTAAPTLAGLSEASREASRSPGTRGRRAATPLDATRSTVPEIPDLEEQPSRRVVQSIMTLRQFHALLVDTQILGIGLGLDVVDDVIAPALFRLSYKTGVLQAADDGMPVSDGLPLQDKAEFAVQYPAFLEALVRIAHYKLTRTAPFMSATSKHAVSLPDQLRYVIETYFIPLSMVMKEVDATHELRKLGLDPFQNEGIENSTLDDLRRTAFRLLKDQQRQARAVRGDRPPSALPGSSGLGDTMTDTQSRHAGESEGRPTSADGISMAADVSAPSEVSCVAEVKGRKRWAETAFRRSSRCTLEVLEVETTRNFQGSFSTARHNVIIQTVDGVSHFGGIVQQSRLDQLLVANKGWRSLLAEDEPGPQAWMGYLPVLEHLENSMDTLHRLYRHCIPKGSQRAQLYRLIQGLAQCGCLKLEGLPSTPPPTTPDTPLPPDDSSAVTQPPTDRPVVMSCFSVLKHLFFDVFGVEIGQQVHCVKLAPERFSVTDKVGVDANTLRMLLKSSPDFAEALKMREMEEEEKSKIRECYAACGAVVGEDLWWVASQQTFLPFEAFLTVIVYLSRVLFASARTAEGSLNRFLRQWLDPLTEAAEGKRAAYGETVRMSRQAPPPIRNEVAWPMIKKKAPPEDPKKKKKK